MRIKNFKKILAGKLTESLNSSWNTYIQPDKEIFKKDIENLINQVKSKL